MFVEADPKFKSVKLYDAQMKQVTKEGLAAYQSASQEAAVKNVKVGQGNDKKKK